MAKKPGTLQEEEAEEREAAKLRVRRIEAYAAEAGAGEQEHPLDPLTAILRIVIRKPSGDGEPTWASLVVHRLLVLAAEGNLRAIQEIWTRLEGKAGAPGTPDPAPFQVDEDLVLSILSSGRDVEDCNHDDDDDDDNTGEYDGGQDRADD
jgi:hypothetical protein